MNDPVPQEQSEPEPARRLPLEYRAPVHATNPFATMDVGILILVAGVVCALDVGQLIVRFALATMSSDPASVGATRPELLFALELTTIIAGLLSGLIMLFLGRKACRRHVRSFVIILVLTFICALSLAIIYVFRLSPLFAYWWRVIASLSSGDMCIQ
jgi:hypothetical protein